MSAITFTNHGGTAQARSVAAELLACADALQAAQGGA